MAELRVERRLTAIFASDVVGYSRLLGADEEGTLARLNVHRREFLEPTIAEHRGRVVKRTGDGVLLEFLSAVDTEQEFFADGIITLSKSHWLFVIACERNAVMPPDKRAARCAGGIS